MKPTTARMLEELRQLTNGLVFSTEGDYYVDPFVWEPDEQGELTLDRLLEAEGYLEEVDIESVFPQNKQFPTETFREELFPEDEKQVELLKFLDSHCTEVQVYVVSKSDAPCKWAMDHPEEHSTVEPFEGFPIILAETKTGEWIGIAPEVKADFETRFGAKRLSTDCDPRLEQKLWQSAFRERERVPLTNRADCYVRFDTESLLESLNIPLHVGSLEGMTIAQWVSFSGEKLSKVEACQNRKASEISLVLARKIKQILLGMELYTRQFFEPDYSVERFVMRIADSKELLLCSLTDAVGFSRVCQFTELHDDDDVYDDDSPIEKSPTLEPLDNWLLSNLTNLQEYVVGCMSIYYLYNVGQNTDGDWVGVTTVGIWT
ncbi:MAG: nuclease A inhibitor family protein [Cyanobacteria bacterium J06626_4]